MKLIMEEGKDVFWTLADESDQKWVCMLFIKLKNRQLESVFVIENKFYQSLKTENATGNSATIWDKLTELGFW